MAITAREIVSYVGMNNHPEYYSGRGAIWTDLSGHNLFVIYKTIKIAFGMNAAEAFVTMVENLRVLSATNFLNALYALEKRNWVYEPVEESIDDEAKLGRDDTQHILATFLAKLGKYPKRDKPEWMYLSY